MSDPLSIIKLSVAYGRRSACVNIGSSKKSI